MATTPVDANDVAGVEQWATSLWRLLPAAAVAGPAIALIGALCVTLQISMLPGDLDWISRPEGLFLLIAIPCLVATWTMVGHRIARRAVRTGLVVTVVGVVGSCFLALTTVMRLFTADLVLHGFDPTALNDVWDGDATVYTIIAFAISFLAGMGVAIIAGVAILKTHVAPAWAGIAFLLFPVSMVAAQAAYWATRVFYPLAFALLLTGVVGATHLESPRAEQEP